MHDVDPGLYTTVIRDLLRHENDVTNHRLMWLLIGQGLIANAYVAARSQNAGAVLTLASVGILMTFSAFIILYKGYQARGYLRFLGDIAKRGKLREQYLPMFGWPRKRIKHWRKGTWLCLWLEDFSDLMDPIFTLPVVLLLAWVFVLLKFVGNLSTPATFAISLLLVVAMLAGLCVLWVHVEGRTEEEIKEDQE
jgi:hypothetical protein